MNYTMDVTVVKSCKNCFKKLQVLVNRSCINRFLYHYIIGLKRKRLQKVLDYNLNEFPFSGLFEKVSIPYNYMSHIYKAQFHTRFRYAIKTYTFSIRLK